MVYRQTERSKRVRAASRERILRAAGRLFVRQGYETTTMQDIVKAARTSVGNLYFYFGNKERLLATLLEEAATAAWEWTDAAVRTVPPGPERLAVMVFANAIELLGTDAGLTRILLLSDTGSPLRQRIADRYASRIRSYIAANVPTVDQRHLDIAVAAWLGAGRSCLEQKLAGNLHDEPMELAAFLVRWNLRGLGVSEHAIDDAITVASRIAVRRSRGHGAASTVKARRRGVGVRRAGASAGTAS